MYPVSQACDWDHSTFFVGQIPINSDPLQQAFYVSWPTTQTIASFFIDSSPNTSQYPQYHYNVYVLGSMNDDLSSRLVYWWCYPFGLFNVQTLRRGTYLMFIPVYWDNPHQLVVSEIRVWSTYHLPALYGYYISNWQWGILTQAYPPQEFYTSGFYVDLYEQKNVSHIWLLLGATNGENFCIYYNNYSAESWYQDSSPQACFQAQQGSNQEISLSVNAQVRFITIGCRNQSNQYDPNLSFFIRKLGVFEPPFNCETNNKINGQWMQSTTIYHVDPFNHPQPAMVHEFYMNTDTVGVLTGDPMACGMKSYSINPDQQGWASLEAPMDPLTQPYKLWINTTNFQSYWMTVWFTVTFQNTNHKGNIQDYINVQFSHICTNNIVTTDQTIPDIHYNFQSWQSVINFLPFKDSVSTQYNQPDLCAKAYYINPSWNEGCCNFPWDGLTYYTIGLNAYLDANTNLLNYIGQSFLFQLSGYNTIYYGGQGVVFPSVYFKFYVEAPAPCTNPQIQLPWSTLQNMAYRIGEWRTYQYLAPPWDQQQGITNYCGPYDYSIVQNQNLAFIENQNSIFVEMQYDDSLAWQVYPATFVVTMRDYPNVTPLNIEFYITIMNSNYDPCPSTTINALMVPLVTMEYVVYASATTQSFDAVTNSQSVFYKIPNLCGPMEYRIVETYPWVFVSPNDGSGTISVQTSQIADVGEYSVTFEAKLSYYAQVTPLTANFLVRITNQTNPCLTTTLSLPTTLVPVTITSQSGNGNTQSFLPATDSASQTAFTPGFCGNIIYSIVEVQYQSFVSIVGPQMGFNPFVADWTLNCFSSNISDVGVWTVTLQAALELYSSVTPATQTFTVTILDECANSEIYTQAMQPVDILNRFNVPSPQTVLSFPMHQDSIGISKGNSVFCGKKTYQTEISWLSVYEPANLNDNFELRVETSDPNLMGHQTVNLIVKFDRAGLTQTITQTISFTIIDPCIETFYSTTQTIASINYMYGDPPLDRPFQLFNNGSVEAQFGLSSLCLAQYDILPQADKQLFGVSIHDQPSRIQVLATDHNLIGQTVALQLICYSSRAPAPNQSSIVSFNLSVTDPCPSTTINALTVPLVTMEYVVAASATTQSFGAVTNSKSVLIPNLCGPMEYRIVETYPWIILSFVNGAGTISVQTTSIAHVSEYSVTFEAKLTNYAGVTPLSSTFLVRITNPCPTTTLNLSTTLLPVTITSLSGVSSTQSFLPAIDSASTTASIPGLCGNRIYSIVESQAQNFVSIIAPSAGLNPYVDNWTLNCLSNNISDVGVWTVTLQSVLELYPSLPPASKTFTVTILDACANSEIYTQTMQPIDILHRLNIASPQTVLSFPMHQDSIGVSKGNNAFCGKKTYQTDNTRLSVQEPANLNDNFELRVETSDPNFFGLQSVVLQVGFERTGLTQTISQTIYFYIIDPCTETFYSTTQTIADLTYRFGDPPLVTPFSVFSDSVSQSHGITDLCTIRYDIHPLANQVPLGVSIDQILREFIIHVIDPTHIGHTFSLSLIAFSQRATASNQSTIVSFNLSVTDPCPSTTINALTVPLVTMEYVVAASATTQSFGAVTNSKSVLIPNLCGPMEYRIVETYPWIILSFVNGAGTISVQTTSIAHVGEHSVTFEAKLTNYAGVTPLSSNFLVRITNPCPTTTLNLLTTLLPVTITSLSGVSNTQSFLPATDSASTTASIPGLCGNRIYSIVESQAQNFVSIIAPSAGFNPYVENWTLNCLSNNISDVGVWTVTLQAVLELYPAVPPATKTVTVTIMHVCATTVILTQPLPPATYQIRYSPTTIIIGEFHMHDDQKGIDSNNKTICGMKTYTKNDSWLTILPPSDPYTENFRLSVTTNDMSLTGPQNFAITVGFLHPSLTQTLVESYSVTFLSPCTETIVTSTQVIPPQSYYFGDSALIYTFQTFSNTVADLYASPNACPLQYSLLPITEAATFGVSLLTGNQISVITSNQSLIGQSITLNLLGQYQTFTNSGNLPVSFTVQIVNSCPSTVIQVPFTSLLEMHYIITQTPVIQTFVLGTDSKSALNSIPNLCGPIEYSIIPSHSFLSITSSASPGTINIQTNLITDQGTYPVTFDAKMTNYPDVPHVQIPFQIIIVNPCLTATLDLPTVLQPVSIVSMSGQASTQLFAPATDTAGLASTPNLCGQRIYSIVEPTYRSFVQVIPTTLDPFVDQWTLQFKSINMSDIGVWTVTLSAALEMYAMVPVATKTVQVTVTNPCLSSVIQPEAIAAMSVSIYDVTPKTQSFLPFKDSEGIFQGNFSFCGPKQYVISNPMTQILPSADGNPLTISAVASSIAQVGVHPVTVTATFVNYPSVAPRQVIFYLTVIDNCATALLDSQGQVLNDMIYVPLLANGPRIQTFLPFRDNVALQYSSPQICGPKTYAIAGAHPFITISLAVGDPFIAAWTISVQTNLLSDIAVYPMTLVATLDNYPNATPAHLQFKVYISHPCDLTRFKPYSILDMSFTLGFVQTVTQQFPQFKDDVADQVLNPKLCGERTYVWKTDHSFLNLQIPVDPWNSPLQIDLFTLDTTKVGQYSATLEVKLVSYSLPPPLLVTFSVTILPTPKNNLPFFEPKLTGSATIQKTKNSTSWSLKLPGFIDLDNDPVTMTVDLGPAGNFLVLDGVEIVCDDISKTTIKAGMYLLKILLNDKRDIATYNLSIFVIDLPPEPVVPKQEDPIPKEEIQSPAEDDPDTSGGDPEEIGEQEESEESEESEEITEEVYDEVTGEITSGSTSSEQLQITKNMTPEQKQAVLSQSTFDWQAAFAKQQALNKATKNSESSIITYAPIPPKPFLKELKTDGKVIIGFQSDVYVVPNLQMINNGTIFLDDFEKKRELASERTLAVTTTRNRKKRFPVLKVEVIPGSDSAPQDLQFAWNVTTQEAQSLSVQLYFNDPMKVSANPVPDKVRVTFNDPTLFVGMNGLMMDAQSQVLERYLPTQVPLTGAAATVAAAIDSASNGAKAVVVGNFIFNILMSASLNQLWSMINTQQLIVLMPLFKIQLPANAQSFFNQILKIASFDIVDLDPYINSMLRLNATEPLNRNFDALGFGSLYFLNNMNSMLIGFLFYFGLILLLVLIDPFQGRCGRKLSSLTEKLRGMLFYNFIISMMTESYSLMSVCCMIGFYKISFGSTGEIIETASCLLALVVLIAYPVLILIVLIQDWNNNRLNTSIERYQTIFEDLRTDQGPISLIHPIYFLFRRFLMAVIVVVLRDHLIFQVMLKAFSIIAAVIIAGAVPYNRVSKRKMEFLNEVIIMFVLYNMICFSTFVPDLNAKQLIGYFCCFVVASHLLLNLYLILSTSIFGLKVKALLWFARRKLAKQKLRNSIKIKKRKRIRMQLNIDFEEEQSPDAILKERKQLRNQWLEPIEEEVSSESEKSNENDERSTKLKQARYQIKNELQLLQNLVNGKDSLEELKIEEKPYQHDQLEKTINPRSLFNKYRPENFEISTTKILKKFQPPDEFDGVSQKTGEFYCQRGGIRVFNEIEEILELDFEESIKKVPNSRNQLNQKVSSYQKPSRNFLKIEEEKDEWEMPYQHFVKKNQAEKKQDEWEMPYQHFVKKNQAQRKRNMNAHQTEHQRFEQIIEDSEAQFWKLYGDPDIEQLPDKLISQRR